MDRLSAYIFLLFLTAPCLVWSADIYVSTTGNNTTGNGSVESPYLTIAHAISVMSGGDDIYLREGTYHEHDIYIGPTKSGTSENWSSLQSYPGEWAIVDGQRANTNNVYATIRNGGFPECTEMTLAKYWKFERLEITGGGASGSADAAGISWLSGPWTIRYCYVHDNYGATSNENPAGINGGIWQNATIEYNFLYNNGATTTNGNARQISTKTQEELCYNESNSGDIEHNGIRNNVIRYNYVLDDTGRSNVGIGMKASNRLVPADGTNRDVTDDTYRSDGDKIHHNIVKMDSTATAAILWQNDWQQIYSNICDMGASYDDYHGAITTRRTLSTGVDTIYPCVYNNTIVGGACGLYHDSDAKYFQTFQGLWVNNILDAPRSLSDDYPITLYHRYNDGDEWYRGEEWPADFNITGVKVDRNYLYRGTQTEGLDILFGKGFYTDGYSQTFTVSRFESAYSVDLFIQSTQESGDNKLWVGTTGADKYRSIGTHNLGETGKTVASSGYNAAHPYLTGVSIPQYIGATNPNDDDWVAGVLALDASYFTSATAGSDPAWIEGDGGEDPPVSGARSTASGTAGWR